MSLVPAMSRTIAKRAPDDDVIESLASKIGTNRATAERNRGKDQTERWKIIRCAEVAQEPGSRIHQDK